MVSNTDSIGWADLVLGRSRCLEMEVTKCSFLRVMVLVHVGEEFGL